MTKPEGERRGEEQQPQTETDPRRYLQVAKFAGERPAGRAYEQAQETIYHGEPNELSVYRLTLQE